MKAIIQYRYGSPDDLRLEEVPKPTPSDDEVLIEIHAVSINGSDREGLTGKPLYARIGGLVGPGPRILGSDIAGRVESVGRNITEFQAGDEVFGELPGYGGGFAEYVCTSGKTLATKPASMTFEEAAAIPQAGVIALRGIYFGGRLQPGQRCLINGAGGSAGSFAIQLAKLRGAEVTGVDNAGKLDFMRSLGADHVVDYAVEDFTREANQYDLILDVTAYHSVFAYRRVLAPDGTCLVVGGSVAVLLQALVLGPLVRRVASKHVRVLAVPQNREDLISITELCKAGKVVPAIDRQYSLREVPEALRYVAEGRSKGKVVISLEGNRLT